MYISQDKPFYNINQVAEILNISADRLRTYDEEGLIIPFRIKKGNKRLYSQFDIEWLQACRKFIKDKKFTIYSFKLILLLINKMQEKQIKEFKKYNSEVIGMIFDLKNNPNFKKVVENITIT